MTHRTRSTFIIGSSLALAVALAVSFPVRSGSAAPPAGMQMTEAQMKDHCEDMMEQKKAMAADMKAQDAALTDLVAKMNHAQGDKQVTLMASVITQMVEQRIAMDARKAKMEDKMMAHMMQHMQMGKDTMTQCPMMQGKTEMKGMAPAPDMKNMDDKPVGAH